MGGGETEVHQGNFNSEFWGRGNFSRSTPLGYGLACIRPVTPLFYKYFFILLGKFHISNHPSSLDIISFTDYPSNASSFRTVTVTVHLTDIKESKGFSLS